MNSQVDPKEVNFLSEIEEFKYIYKKNQLSHKFYLIKNNRHVKIKYYTKFAS